MRLCCVVAVRVKLEKSIAYIVDTFFEAKLVNILVSM
jgi:hypothetical protein